MQAKVGPTSASGVMCLCIRVKPKIVYLEYSRCFYKAPIAFRQSNCEIDNQERQLSINFKQKYDLPRFLQIFKNTSQGMPQYWLYSN